MEPFNTRQYYKTRGFKAEAQEENQRLRNAGEFCCFVIKNDFSAISARQLLSCEGGGAGDLILGIDLPPAGGNKSGMKPKQGSYDSSHRPASVAGKGSDVRQRPRLS